MRTTNQRMMWRKMFVLMGAAALVAGTLACGGDEATDGTAPPSTPETSVAQEGTGGSVEQEAAAAVAGHEVTVTEVAAPSEMMSDVTLYAPEADGSWPVTVLFAGWDSVPLHPGPAGSGPGRRRRGGRHHRDRFRRGGPGGGVRVLAAPGGAERMGARRRSGRPDRRRGPRHGCRYGAHGQCLRSLLPA